jgi:hypothetical protein
MSTSCRSSNAAFFVRCRRLKHAAPAVGDHDHRPVEGEAAEFELRDAPGALARPAAAAEADRGVDAVRQLEVVPFREAALRP